MSQTTRSDWLHVLLDADPIPEYRDVARHHHRGGLPGRVTSFSSMAIVGFVVISAALGIAASRPAAIAERQELQSRVLAAKSAAVDAERNYLEARRELDATETAIAPDIGGSLSAELDLQTLLAGYSAVTGPGVQLTLNDAERSIVHDQVDLGRVIDRDLQRVVNALWRSGAEAIGINGRRLSVRTPIRNAGSSILVDYRPLTPPYVVRAIGSAAMFKRFQTTSEWQELVALRDRYGVRWSASSVQQLSLPEATSSLPRLALTGGN